MPRALTSILRHNLSLPRAQDCRPWEESKTYGSTLLDVFVVTVTSWECLQLAPKDEHFNVEWEFGTREVPSCPCLVLGPSGVTWYIIPRPRVSTLTT